MILFPFFFIFIIIYSQTIKQLNQISINEELPIGTIITLLNDKIPNLDQSLEYDLVKPFSSELDLFSIDHIRHTLNIKKRIDFEQICLNININHCLISISIAVSNYDTIIVYTLPIHIKNIDDNSIKFFVNRTIIEIEENDEYWFNKTYKLPHAYDADGDIITYSLYLHNWNKPDGLFELDNKNLLLKPLKKFDREKQNLYLLRLIAENKYQRDISIDIIIIIKDINDNSPQCEHNKTIFSINNINSISIFKLNITDLDENNNSKLEYNLINYLSGFSIDHINGYIIFNYTEWKYTNETKLFINITDYGKPYRLSTQCIVEFKLTFLFDINLKLNNNNEKNNIISIDNLNLPIGQLIIIDKQEKNFYLNYSFNINTSLYDIFYLNKKTLNIYFNLNSLLLNRILTNNIIKNENLSINISIYVWNINNPLIISIKNYSLIFNLNKEKLFQNSNIIFIKIHENILLNEKISLNNNYSHICLNNKTKKLILIDSTNTFYIDQYYNLIIKKYLNIKQQQNYELILKDNQTNEINQCTITVRIHIYNSYSISNIYPYFSQSFYILTSNNISKFVLPLLPSYVKYISSKPNEILIDEKNGSITIQSSSLFSFYSYDFYIRAIDFQIPSLSCSIPIRIYFGINKQLPRLYKNLTKHSIEISSSELTYQIQAYDPDLSFNDQNNLFPPSIEYEIDSLENIEIERYTGRIFFKNINQSIYNFTVILIDFGQPNRLITRQKIIFNLISNNKLNHQEIPIIISTTFILISACIFSIIILLIIIILLFNCYQGKLSTKKSLSNLSPTTPDSCLIDNEYITTTTSLPRVINREQRIYPTISNDNQRKLLEQIHLPPPLLYSNEKVSIKQDYQRNLSMNDINKYLERFEKIYNNSSEHHLGEPVGSVV
ncbi:unnamed protein product [Rotaria sp. Silwood1]|nr:unnamed protein product [Rotaria sp. Silwood1]CAF4606464.1 unnamed protein product [Rotaria sp. Silwood1]